MELAVLIVFVCIIFIFIFLASLTESDTLTSINDNDSCPTDDVRIEQNEHYASVYFDTKQVYTKLSNIDTVGGVSMSAYEKKADRELVHKGDLLTTLYFSTTVVSVTPSAGYTKSTKKASREIISPCDGYVVFQDTGSFCYGNEVYLVDIYPQYEEMLKRAFPFTYEIGFDSISNCQTIKWSSIDGRKFTQYLELTEYGELSISFSFINNSPAVLFYYKYKTFKGTTLILQFEDGVILPFNFWENARRDGDHSILLNKSFFKKLKSSKIKTIRIKTGEEHVDYHIKDHQNENLSQFVLAFEEALAKCNISIPEETVTEEPAKKDDSCWVYIMRDIANNSYKIGISNNPRYRERTLQSQKPTIEKLAAKKYPSRTIARTIEASLHKVYQEKHIRGEWFCLDSKEVNEIIQSLS